MIAAALVMCCGPSLAEVAANGRIVNDTYFERAAVGRPRTWSDLIDERY